MHSDLDVMPVRTDEQFDYWAMQAYLRARLPHVEGTLEVQPLVVGMPISPICCAWVSRSG